ncbi:hypothetical protein [Posidoniimonas polymericola]|uniref:hypothetical protein n=1 Tax=Posidoniimonas polymericola TaxID=2528002 RepID=UPI0011B42871|nr:hypothetical protein [Posidoniimonas polymericola]
MPDREDGYVRRRRGVLPPDLGMADQYRTNASEDAADFYAPEQRTIIEAVLDAAPFIQVEVHSIATEATHFHVLASWRSERDRIGVSNSLRGRVRRELRLHFSARRWLARDASRRQVKDRQHFEYLVQTYLPRHRGLKWDRKLGIYE